MEIPGSHLSTALSKKFRKVEKEGRFVFQTKHAKDETIFQLPYSACCATESALTLVSVSTVLPLDWEDVATCSEITREKRMSKQKSSISCNLRISSHINIFISSQIYIPRLLPCNVSHTTRNQSASKLQQLPWTAVFEDLQLLLRSADAPGLTP